MSLYQIENRAYDRMEKLKVVNISYQFFSREKKCRKSLCSFRTPSLVFIDVFFHNIRGNGGARGASHIVILFNSLRPKSDLNEISYCNIKG